ncbi:MAG: peptide chain release factor N(5)-glutamine methyltransferase [Gammaproteobacteria bacterium]|jgi:release factor glutamine methyltransferase|nr:peptide chain release factor N(5)-glutamine methyltransferase [Gammaproteobacteria bacterium]MBT3859754.1 peptide chain release factor N(5)-glutamine methyltransferase [Gammaproteobacteria bacterium]MBT3987275.1 peptide chain release factor N(5)-glutamine methyltransferase [Gammaproteobacteria bacterium]MBT4256317.1 peptide chain release factor N(5)-glutamine methyltransferase [Gammaproteobacteria bacterium]MBT4582279.1 peptide chain release factor N(5)-glutamine methyltransferase [Gammaprot
MAENIRQVLSRGEALRPQSESWQLDTELLLARVLNKPREYLFTWPEQELQLRQIEEFQQLLSRRKDGEPIAYILGKRGFWDFELEVNSSVLIPRPETEILVETAIELLSESRKTAAKIADLGTGSGAIALALAKSCSSSSVIAVDFSEDALNVAKSNASNLGISNIEFIQASWCDGLQDNDFDMIVSNPPYVAEGDAHLLEGDLLFEPSLALVATENGLGDLHTIALQCREKLKKGSWLLLEHGYDQKQAVAEMLERAGYFNIQCRKDLSGVDRLSFAQWGGSSF